jgi:internalin A
VASPQARAAADAASAPARMRLFVSYAHADDGRIRKRLSAHLTILGERGYIQTWQDTQLVAGEQWEDRILEELGQADIILLLYSTASRASKFIQEIEAPRAVARATAAGNACSLIVVPLDRNDWDPSVALERDLRQFQTATWNARPVFDFSPQGRGWQEVEHSIRKAVELQRGNIAARRQ